jgi:hypothetical protein
VFGAQRVGGLADTLNVDNDREKIKINFTRMNERQTQTSHSDEKQKFGFNGAADMFAQIFCLK